MTRARTLALSALLACAPRLALADGVDAAAPTVVTLGVDPGPAPVATVDGARTRRAIHALPDAPRERRRHSVGAIAHPPVVGARGLTVALVAPELVRLDASGAEVFRVRLGPATAAASPVITSDGGAAVLTTASAVVFVSPAGRITATVPLPSPVVRDGAGSSGPPASILPLADGGVLVGGRESVFAVDRAGRVRFGVALPDTIAQELVAHPDGALAILESGTVHMVSSPEGSRLLGRLSGAAPGALASPRTLLAPAGPGRVVALDLRSGALLGRVAELGFSGFDAAPALGAHGELWLTTHDGFLLGYDASGAPTSRQPIDRGAQPQPVIAPGGARPGRSGATFGAPAPLVDPEGRVAFLRPTGRVGVRRVSGEIVLGAERACAAPLALVPAGPGRFVVACREGVLVTYGEGDEPDPPPGR